MGPERATVLLTGASGFVGGELLPALKESGSIRCLVRDASRLQMEDQRLAVKADLSDIESLAPALEGMDEVYYLVHSMEPGGGQQFAEKDRRAAENYVDVARKAGVRRTIYLGGVAGDGDESDHLASRLEVEGLLAESAPEFVGLRASMIVGSGSASFGSLVRIVSRLPVLALPDWRDRSTNPIAISDVIQCLVKARTVDPGVYEIAGPDTLTFEEMTKVIADLLGDTHRSFPLPFSNAKVEAAGAALVTGEKRELLEPLMAGLDGDLVIRENRAVDLFEVESTPFVEAARRAIDGMPDEETE